MTSTAPSSDAYVVHQPRIELHTVAQDSYRAMFAFSRSLRLDRTLHHLIEIRVSQVNGCAFCLDMHLHGAREAGESNQRLDTIAGWRESPFFTARERAALALAEAMTRLADRGHVPDAVYDEAAAHFDEEELTQVIYAITVINSWNRLVVTTGTLPPTR